MKMRTQKWPSLLLQKWKISLYYRVQYIDKKQYNSVYSIKYYIMSFFINILVFFLVLIFYIQIAEQHKKNNDLEVYQLDYIERKDVHDYCRLKLPIVINYNNVNPEFVSRINKYDLMSAAKYLQIKNEDDFYKEIPDNSYVEMDTQNANILFETSSDESYYTEKNDEMIRSCSLRKVFESNDFLLKPDMNVVTEYDVLFGKEHSHTPFRYHTQQRKFICCHEGSVSIKMASWNSTDLLNATHDYECYDFRSPIRIWNPQPEWKANVKQLETLDIVLEKGCMLYIPSFWWYSIQFQRDSLVSSSQYSSFMNSIYNIPSWVLHYIQETSMEDRLANLKGYFSNSKPEMESIKNEPAKISSEEPVLSKQDEPQEITLDKIDQDSEKHEENNINIQKEIKDTLDSITIAIEEEQNV